MIQQPPQPRTHEECSPQFRAKPKRNSHGSGRRARSGRRFATCLVEPGTQRTQIIWFATRHDGTSAELASLWALPESGRTIVAGAKPCQEWTRANNALKSLHDRRTCRFGFRPEAGEKARLARHGPTGASRQERIAVRQLPSPRAEPLISGAAVAPRSEGMVQEARTAGLAGASRNETRTNVSRETIVSVLLRACPVNTGDNRESAPVPLETEKRANR
jgi:hypothetical protein